MFKVGDEVWVKGKIKEIRDGEKYPFKVRFADMEDIIFSEEEMIPADKTYEQGLADAWELAKKILYGIDKQLIEIFELNVEPAFFDLTHKREIINSHTPQEALAKIEAYKMEKEIKVGDVVKCGVYTCVVTVAYTETAEVLFGDGTFGTIVKEKVENTGKHIDIESLLRQIGE